MQQIGTGPLVTGFRPVGVSWFKSWDLGQVLQRQVSEREVQKIKKIATLGSGSLAKLCLYGRQVSSEVRHLT